MKKTHRNVEFDVHRLHDGRWEWIAYPKLGEGERFAGALEDDEEKATDAARAAIDARLGPLPDPSRWSGTPHWDDGARMMRQRNAALLDSGGSQVFPPPEPKATLETAPMNQGATVNTPAGAVADTAPREIRLETGEIRLEGHPPDVALTGAGNLAAYADVYRVASVRDNAERAEKLAGALAKTIRQEIQRLEDQRRNEREWRDQIDFLRTVANTLDNIVAAIAEARRAATPEERDQKFSEAERWATSLAKAAKDFAERNYERVVDYGGYCTMTILSTLLFTTMFGVSPEFALTSTMVLLGFSGKKKD
jgi:hypothetical protein